jgi:hypothetical protein
MLFGCFTLIYAFLWQATELKSWRSDEVEHCCEAVRRMEMSTTALRRSENLAPEFSGVGHPMLSLVANYQAGETCLCLLEFFFFLRSDYHPPVTISCNFASAKS